VPATTSPGGVTVLVPAHNEARQIASTLRGLQTQTLPPRRIIVIADNCVDDTVAAAAAVGAEVYETTGNRDKKAGALNQAWRMRFRRVRDRRTGRAPGPPAGGPAPAGWSADRRRGERRTGHTGVPDLGDNDFVLVQDADSQLDAGFLAGAVSHLSGDETLGAVGGTFRGGEGAGLVGHLQRNEYARYARDVRRLKGKCLVVTGTAAMFRTATLQQISAARRVGTLPAGDGDGGIYDTTVLTEDNEMTFAIRHLGYRVLSPRECTLTTEVMLSWGDLWKQRLRWKRGAVENCFQYGITRVTWPYWGRQLLTLFGIVVTFLYLASLLVAVGAGEARIQPLWLAVTLVFVAERAITVRDRGWRYMLAAATMYELLYDIFLQVVHAKAYVDAALVRERRW
jgi:biofilm PGA synthesis N-glycosyltransferase PgaC